MIWNILLQTSIKGGQESLDYDFAKTEPTWLILILWNSIIFRGLDRLSSFDFPTFFSSWDERPDLIGLESLSLFLEGSSCCSMKPRGPLFDEGKFEEWACKTSSLATDSATFSSHVRSKEDDRLSSGVEPQTIFAFRFCNFDTCKWVQENFEKWCVDLRLRKNAMKLELAPAWMRSLKNLKIIKEASSIMFKSKHWTSNCIFCYMSLWLIKQFK